MTFNNNAPGKADEPAAEANDDTVPIHSTLPAPGSSVPAQTYSSDISATNPAPSSSSVAFPTSSVFPSQSQQAQNTVPQLAFLRANHPSSGSSSPTTSTAGDETDEEERKRRFKTAPRNNRFLEMKAERTGLRERYIAQGIIPDPDKPRQLSEATKLRGTCLEMCPAFEREEREFQGEGDELEVSPGTSKLDPRLAVKIYRRPAAGRELPLPEDVRPPTVLRKTLDYLFYQLLPPSPDSDRLVHVQGFIWNRTRAIRQDFIVQGEAGPLTIECHERIARWHLLSLHWQGGSITETGHPRASLPSDREPWSQQQELEQLAKTLTSLCEFYNDLRGTTGEPAPSPNEAEFRAYHLILNIFDPEVLRSVELLPEAVFDAPILQTAIRLRGLAQRANRGGSGRANALNTDAPMNFFSRFVHELRSPKVPYLLACIVENQLGQIRQGALRALSSNYNKVHRGPSVSFVREVLGADSDDQVLQWAEDSNMQLQNDGANNSQQTLRLYKGVELDSKATLSAFSVRIVEAKRGNSTSQQIVDGVASAAAPLLGIDGTQSVAPSTTLQTSSLVAPTSYDPASQIAQPQAKRETDLKIPDSSSRQRQGDSTFQAFKKRETDTLSPFAAAFVPKSSPSDPSASLSFQQISSTVPTEGFKASASAATSQGRVDKAPLHPPAPQPSATLFGSTPKLPQEVPSKVDIFAQSKSQSVSGGQRHPPNNLSNAPPHQLKRPTSSERPESHSKKESRNTVAKPAEGNIPKHDFSGRILKELLAQRVKGIAEQALNHEKKRKRSAHRSKLLEGVAKHLYEALLDEHTLRYSIQHSRQALAEATRARFLQRRVFATWVNALQRSREALKQRQRLEYVRRRVAQKSLLRGSKILSEKPRGDIKSTPSASALGSSTDEDLRASFNTFKTERLHLWAEGSFFVAIAQRVSDLVLNWRFSESITWTTLLCLDEAIGTENAPAKVWLKHKFGLSAAQGEKLIPVSPEVTIRGQVIGSNNPAPNGHVDLGLLVFVLSPKLADVNLEPRERTHLWSREQGRLQDLGSAELFRANRFAPLLLVIDWRQHLDAEAHQQTLRLLGLSDPHSASPWRDIGIVALGGAEDTDATFQRGISLLLRSIYPVETASRVSLDQVVRAFRQPWTDFALLTQSILSQLPRNTAREDAKQPALESFATMLALINHVMVSIFRQSETLLESEDELWLPKIDVAREVEDHTNEDLQSTLFDVSEDLLSRLLAEGSIHADLGASFLGSSLLAQARREAQTFPFAAFFEALFESRVAFLEDKWLSLCDDDAFLTEHGPLQQSVRQLEDWARDGIALLADRVRAIVDSIRLQQREQHLLPVQDTSADWSSEIDRLQRPRGKKRNVVDTSFSFEDRETDAPAMASSPAKRSKAATLESRDGPSDDLGLSVDVSRLRKLIASANSLLSTPPTAQSFS